MVYSVIIGIIVGGLNFGMHLYKMFMLNPIYFIANTALLFVSNGLIFIGAKLIELNIVKKFFNDFKNLIK